jgi:predicted dehydrogenase
VSSIRIVSSTGPLKAAVVGAGAFGHHHAAKYRAIDGVELTAIADPLPAVRKAMAETYGIAVTSNWRDLLGKVDLVTVATPAVTHAEIVRAFLNSGANVLVEKPIATSLEEADGLIALAERTGRVLTVDHQERFVFTRTGLLGYDEIPLEVSCWRMGPWSGRGVDVSIVLDLMIHDLDLVHQLIPGKVRSVAANGRVEKSAFADEVAAAVMFENGAVARLKASRISERRRGMRAVYADGVVEIDFLTRKVINTTARPLNALEMNDPLGESVASFVNAVRGRVDPLVKPREARRALATALLIDEAVERSAPLRRVAVEPAYAFAR